MDSKGRLEPVYDGAAHRWCSFCNKYIIFERKSQKVLSDFSLEEELTQNELNVLVLLKKRLTISEIAQKLEISEEKLSFLQKLSQRSENSFSRKSFNGAAL